VKVRSTTSPPDLFQRLPDWGAGWMLVAGFFFALMGVFVKLEGGRFSSIELVFYRSLTGFVVIFWVARLSGRSFRTPHWWLHLRRSSFGVSSLLLYFFALTRLPLATAVTLNYTSPVFLALVLIVMSRERPSLRSVVAILLGFLGVALVLAPHLGQDQWWAGLAGLLSGLFAGLVFFNVRAMGAVGEPEWRVVLYFTLFCTCVSGLLVLLPLVTGPVAGAERWDMTAPHALHWGDLPLLLGVGLSALFGQLAMTRAYKTGPVWLSSQFAYFTIVFSSLFDIVLQGEWLSPPAWIGMAIIIAGGVMQHARPVAFPEDRFEGSSP
jgi:drug/metabolite transporter (DMT)-like permease